MIRMRAVIGVCALCALAMSAIGAQGASAAIKGTTGFTCKEKKEPGGAGFSEAHCTAASAVETGAKFEHVVIPENVPTEGTGVNVGVMKMKSVQSGVTLELQSTEGTAVAGGVNKVNAEGEHYIEGSGFATLKNITVTAPAGKGCKVKGGEVTSKELRATSLGQGMEGKLEPVAGTTFAEFTVEGCTIAALNHLYTVTGSIKCPGDGATVKCTHAATTAQGTLRLSGQNTGVEGTATAVGRKNSTEPFTPLAATTVETP